MKYRKKPVEIEAERLNARGMIGAYWFWEAVSENRVITHNFGKAYPDDAWCEIKTLEGIMTAKTGDYIIKGIQGELYSCQPDIFGMTYEKFEADPPAQTLAEQAIDKLQDLILTSVNLTKEQKEQIKDVIEILEEKR